MSYREIRDFIDKMCLLGYPRLLSRENFRTNNFPLVAEILHWFYQRLDPADSITYAIDSEQERVTFTTSVVQFLNSKLNLKLNAKRLYQAENLAVRELLSIANILVNALKLAEKGDLILETHPDFIQTREVSDIKEMRQLVSDITTQGASIFDFLGKEATLTGKRVQVLQRNYELTQIESALQAKIQNMEQQVRQTQEAIDNISTSEAQLDQKIEKKTAEVQRLRKRLETMKNIRPPFMDEFEKLEAELRLCYDEYVNKFRCLSYLEQQLQELEKSEQQELEERQATARKMAERLRQEETLQALEAAVGGTWEGGQDFDLSPQGSLDHLIDNSVPAAGRPRNSGRRFASVKNDALDRLDLDETEESDSELDDGEAANLNDRLGTNSDSDVTVDEWHNELRTWEVGANPRHGDKTKETKLIRPTLPPHVGDDDF